LSKPVLAVVPLTTAFESLWPDLAAGVAADLRDYRSDEPVPTATEVAAVLLAAGGREGEVRHWLDRWGGGVGAPVFVAGADPDRRLAVRIVSGGARDYFVLPEDTEVLRNAIAAAVERAEERLRSERERKATRRDAFRAMVGASVALKELIARAERILDHVDTTALIVGETGTGKELLARAIHDGGRRRSAPFVPVNCSALPDTLIESELFGHERGAFTSAHAAKPGLFEVADGGTLFLDEIGTVPLDLQAKLLRVLEDREVRRVGGVRARRVDIRIVAATNENPRQLVKDGRFREDLYYRLGVIVLNLPPLRDRGDDVLMIAQAHLEHLARRYGLPEPRLVPESRTALLSYHWPGNVRELRNTIERALLLSPPGELDVTAFLAPDAEPAPVSAGAIPFPSSLEAIETAAASAMVDLCDGNRSEAARRLGISRQRLRRLLGTEGNGRSHGS
jgi:DNA-binding NtrC family response regulator